MTTAEREDKIIFMVITGMSFQEIADELGIARQRVHQIFKNAVEKRRKKCLTSS